MTLYIALNIHILTLFAVETELRTPLFAFECLCKDYPKGPFLVCFGTTYSKARANSVVFGGPFDWVLNHV